MQSSIRAHRPHIRTILGLDTVAPIHFLAYFLAGVATVALGTILPQLVRNWSMSDARAGFLFSALFSGSALGSLVSTRKPEWSYPVGFWCCGIAIPFIQSASSGYLDFVILLEGIGLGLIVNSGNVLVGNSAERAGTSRAAALARVHFAWGVGAVSCPWILRPILLNRVNSPFFLPLFGAVFAVLGVFLAWNVRRPPRTSNSEITSERSLISLETQFFFALALFLYTGIENSISGWLPVFALRIYGAGAHSIAETAKSGSLPALCFTLFWTMHLLGRALLPVAVHSWSEARILQGTVAALLAAVILLPVLPGHFSDNGVLLCVTAAACGFSLASVYPLLIADLLKQSGNLRLGGWILGCAPLGGALLPWISGIVSKYSGSIRCGLIQLAFAVVLLLILVFRLRPISAD